MFRLFHKKFWVGMSRLLYTYCSKSLKFLFTRCTYVFINVWFQRCTYVFVVPKSQNLAQSLLLGFLFGIIAYGVYDLVNLATLKDWSLRMTVIDMLWGGMVCSIVSLITSYFFRWKIRFWNLLFQFWPARGQGSLAQSSPRPQFRVGMLIWRNLASVRIFFGLALQRY